MGKQWLNLVALAALMVGVVVGWDIYLTVIGLKGDFSYTIVPIEPYLYEDLKAHFEQDPGFAAFQTRANGSEGLGEFADTLPAAN